MCNMKLATGGKGKSFNDRELAGRVRTLTLEKIEALFTMPEVKMKADDYDLYKQILVKLAGSILPRLNEHTGEGGDPIVVQIERELAEKYNVNPTPKGNSK